MSTLASVVQRTLGDEMMKTWKLLLATLATVAALNFSFAEQNSVAVPQGWIANGDFGRHFTTEQRGHVFSGTKFVFSAICCA